MFKFLKTFEQFRFAFIITAGFKMSKKIKLTTIFEIDDNQHVDEIMLERQISSIGKIHSFDIDYDLFSESDQSKEITNSKTISPSDISDLLNRNNKIYFESISVEERKLLAVNILLNANLSSIERDRDFKKKFIKMLIEKFSQSEEYVLKLIENTKNNSLLEILKVKFLETDLIMMFIFIFRSILSKGEEDFWEIELIEGTSAAFSIENINDIKKMANERVKIIKAINKIESDELTFKKLKALEKNIMMAFILIECTYIDGKVTTEQLNQLKITFNEKFNFSNNAISFFFQKHTNDRNNKKISDSLIKRIEKTISYKEKYELLVYFWEALLTGQESNVEINDEELRLVRIFLRKFDMSDIESAEAKKEAKTNLLELLPTETNNDD